MERQAVLDSTDDGEVLHLTCSCGADIVLSFNCGVRLVVRDRAGQSMSPHRTQDRHRA